MYKFVLKWVESYPLNPQKDNFANVSDKSMSGKDDTVTSVPTFIPRRSQRILNRKSQMIVETVNRNRGRPRKIYVDQGNDPIVRLEQDIVQQKSEGDQKHVPTKTLMDTAGIIYTESSSELVGINDIRYDLETGDPEYLCVTQHWLPAGQIQCPNFISNFLRRQMHEDYMQNEVAGRTVAFDTPTLI